MGVHWYLINDAVRADFVAFSYNNFRSSGINNIWVHLVDLNKSVLAYQSYEDSMNFP